MAKSQSNLHREALLYETVADRTTICQLCEHRCPIEVGQAGLCRVRKNVGGRLQTAVYGYPYLVDIDAVESKPIYHYFPGATFLSFGTVGCNFNCSFCINWEIVAADLPTMNTPQRSPRELIAMAVDSGCTGVCATFVEPTIYFEYCLDVFREARKANLRTIMLTNGYMSVEAWQMLIPYLSAVKIDLKGSSADYVLNLAGGDPDIAQEAAGFLLNHGIWLELSTVVVPNAAITEYTQMIDFILEKLSDTVPFHILRMLPAAAMVNLPPTSLDLLTALRDEALAKGMKHVYLSNIPGESGNHTYCAGCRNLLIKRFGSLMQENHLIEGNCPQCLRELAGHLNSN